MSEVDFARAVYTEFDVCQYGNTPKTIQKVFSTVDLKTASCSGHRPKFSPLNGARAAPYTYSQKKCQSNKYLKQNFHHICNLTILLILAWEADIYDSQVDNYLFSAKCHSVTGVSLYTQLVYCHVNRMHKNIHTK